MEPKQKHHPVVDVTGDRSKVQSCKEQYYIGTCYVTSIREIRDQSLSRVRLFATPSIAARHASLSITTSRSSLRLTSIQSVMPSSHLILCRPFLLLPSVVDIMVI